MPLRALNRFLSCLSLLFSVSVFALSIELTAESIEHPALPETVDNVRLSCVIAADKNKNLQCNNGELRATIEKQKIDASFNAVLGDQGQWRASGRTGLKALSWSDASGRYATEQLDLNLNFNIQSKAGSLSGSIDARLPKGQAYVEPVFIDFNLAPLRLQTQFRLHLQSLALDVQQVLIEQDGVFRANGNASFSNKTVQDARLVFEQVHISKAFPSFVQPYLVGTSLEHLHLGGEASGELELRAGKPARLDLTLIDASMALKPADAQLSGLSGALHWRAAGPAPDSALLWRSARLSTLPIEGASARFRTQGSDLELLAPLRIPFAGGALKVRNFSVKNAGSEQRTASLDAQIEPIDLAQLCRAFGWPEFGGTLEGHLPGLSLKERELRLDGTLTANAFDGNISVDQLRVLDPFGRVPRVASNIHLRNLDLAALTGAFSFGRIDGRLDGDVEDLRLINWKPVAFRARLETPEDDRSRHRISQRAIDNISSIGGGPSGILSRGVLKFFDDFAYAKIGWSCTLSNGICTMGGIEPSKDGGYVLVKGRWLPRIDVVGYSRKVDWNTFVSQLSSIRQGGPPQLR